MKTDYCPIIINEKYNLLPRVEPINNSYLTLRFYLENTLNKKLSAINSIAVFSLDSSEDSQDEIERRMNYLIEIEKREIKTFCKYIEALEKVQ